MGHVGMEGGLAIAHVHTPQVPATLAAKSQARQRKDCLAWVRWRRAVRAAPLGPRGNGTGGESCAARAASAAPVPQPHPPSGGGECGCVGVSERGTRREETNRLNVNLYIFQQQKIESLLNLLVSTVTQADSQGHSLFSISYRRICLSCDLSPPAAARALAARAHRLRPRRAPSRARGAPSPSITSRIRSRAESAKFE